MENPNFKDRTCRTDKRRKNYYNDNLMGDLTLAVDEFGIDNSMGDYNCVLEEFILSLNVPNVRERFQDFIVQWHKTNWEG